jgi:hypothetical protein
MEPDLFLDGARGFLEGRGFLITNPEPGKDLSYIEADLYALKRGRSFGVFFPYEDHLFFHVLSGASGLSRANVENLHEKARKHVNGLFRVPRSIRYKVPNIVTVGVSRESFPMELTDYTLALGRDIVGGEIHAVLLVDLSKMILVSRGLQTTRTPGASVTFRNVTPENRAQILLHDLLDSLRP